MLKIAFRNLVKGGKRTLLIGITVFISCMLLLFSFAVGNGLQQQIMKRYSDFQSGDVTVVWSNVKEIDRNDPSRLYFSKYDIKKKEENARAIRNLNDYLQSRGDEIAMRFETVQGSGILDTGRYASFSTVRGVSATELKYLEENRIFRLAAGDTPLDHEYGICISDDVSDKYGIRTGDWVTLDCTTGSGYVNTLEYQVVGLYRSSSDFDSVYVYMNMKDALELTDQEPGIFQSERIYLRNPGDSLRFAEDLDTFLTGSSDVLRAEPMSYSAEFYSSISGMLKTMFLLFVVFILFVIAVGIRSAVRMNLFEHMREFGTLRAIGFSRARSFLLIFLEMFMLSVLSFAVAYAVTLALVLVLGRTGIHIGKGAVAYAIGGESVYPIFVQSDTLAAFAIITLFSLFAPLKPGLRLCLQTITRLLAQDQKQVSVILSIMKGARKPSGIRNTIG